MVHFILSVSLSLRKRGAPGAIAAPSTARRYGSGSKSCPYTARAARAHNTLFSHSTTGEFNPPLENVFVSADAVKRFGIGDVWWYHRMEKATRKQ
eukprot:8861407-Pyramimonas_sp.AAC.1